jgi:hypothetical protein
VKAAQGERPVKRDYTKGRVINEKREKEWSTLIQNRYLKGQCFLCGNSHHRREACTGTVIDLKDHIKDHEENASQK